MVDFQIIPLTDKPEWAETCAAWSYSEWGCQSGAKNKRTLTEVITSYKDSLSSPSDLPLTWIAIRHNKPAGMARLKMDDHPDRPDLYPWLASVFVHPAHRQKKIAQSLCQHVEAEARNVHGFEQIYLFTHTAEKLYEKMGWKAVDTLRDPTGLNPYGETLMIKKL